MGIELFKHNAIAYDKVTKMFETENRVCVIHPTGCGKSFISLKWLEENRDKRAVFLAPTVSILINNNNSAKVLGFSATPIRYLDEHRNMAEELFHGNVASEITLEEAMVNGILPIPTYINAVYSFKDDIENMQ